MAYLKKKVVTCLKFNTIHPKHNLKIKLLKIHKKKTINLRALGEAARSYPSYTLPVAPPFNPLVRVLVSKPDPLVQLLNADSTGDTKPLDKWKKVWSDFKNNTKKKAAKLHQAASGTGGGPAMHARLSDLESRVLRLIGVQAATGLSGVTEAGFLQLPTPQPTPSTSVLQEAEQNTILSPTEVELHNAGPSFPPEATVEDLVDEVHTPPPPSTPRRMPTELAPSPSGHTPQRRRGRGTRQMSQRRSNADEAAQHFLNSDREWRKFKMDVHRDMLDLKKEKLRVRELELATQRGWQTLAKEALNLIKEYINK